MEALFWSFLLVGVYPYAIYPLVAALLAKRSPLATTEGPSPSRYPRVTVVIAAYNEATHIRDTVANKLTQLYPKDLLDVLVVSDASTDGTDVVLEALSTENSRVKALLQPVRSGKTSALNLAFEHTNSEVVVISDANSMYHEEAISHLVENFSNPNVGYVTGSMRYVNSDGSLVGDGCSVYMRYENRLRESETRIGSIVGVDGGIDAIRRHLYRPMRPDQLPDFVLPLAVVEQGYRVVYEPSALLQESALTSYSSEYRMRVRVALRAFWALWDMRAPLNPFKHGIFSFQLLSHKVLRYLSFIPLCAALATSWLISTDSVVFWLAAVGQVLLLLLLTLASAGRREIAKIPLPAFAQYFVLLNVASAVALSQFLRGQKKVLWQPRQG